MNEKGALKILDTAIKQDRERFFKIADSLAFQPKYRGHLDELEEIKQEWRDLTNLNNYPNINFPPPLPVWFPEWQFIQITKDETLNEMMAVD